MLGAIILYNVTVVVLLCRAKVVRSQLGTIAEKAETSVDRVYSIQHIGTAEVK